MLAAFSIYCFGVITATECACPVHNLRASALGEGDTTVSNIDGYTITAHQSSINPYGSVEVEGLAGALLADAH